MNEPGSARPVRVLFGVPIDALTMDEVLARIDHAVEHRARLQIGVVNAAKLVNMRRDAELRNAVLSSDLILADGMSVVWASRMLRRALPERVAGIDLMTAMLERGNQRGYRVYCLGAEASVLDTVVATIKRDYPGVRVAGSRNGYFGPDEEGTVAAGIAAAKPDILLVAMTSPKKELFLEKWTSQIDVPVCHGVGGSFDVMAGKVLRAPEAWQRLGLEWLYRVKQEPRRLWRRYLVTNLLFGGMLLGELARAMTGRSGHQPRRRLDGKTRRVAL
jgi:N-acetylglucosaminyldiphosphoundecaprenol N-acetyl-beta-D-mannosaminyltransferase